MTAWRAAVDLKRLGHLVALADECHFARAAERVHLSQPAFSRSIQSIERDLGMRLFDRDSGDVKPTPAGAFLVSRARRLLFDARCLQRDAMLYRGSQLGDTAFGAGPFAAATIMPTVVVKLRSQYPGVGLRLEASNTPLLCDRLLAEDIEFFVADVRDLPADAALQVQSLGVQPAHLFARAGHPLAGRPCTFAEAWDCGFASGWLPAALKALVARLIGLPPGNEPVPALQSDDMTLLRTVALATDTVFAASDAWVRDDVRAGTLVRLDVTDLPPSHTEMGVVMLAHRTPSPMAQRAIDCVQEVARAINQSPARAPGSD
jgi:DNA-binding transcriptional LysR family regulator